MSFEDTKQVKFWSALKKMRKIFSTIETANHVYR